VAFALTTVFVETYQIGFLPGGLQPADDPATIIEICFIAIFVMDMIITFNLAYQDEQDVLVLDRKKIARHYLRFWFWVDLIGVFPFYPTALGITGNIGVDSQTTRYLQLLRLLRLVRLYRIKSCFETLQYSSRISLLWLTLIRDFGAALMWTHFAACGMFFIARQSDFEDSWLTPEPSETNYDLYGTYMLCKKKEKKNTFVSLHGADNLLYT
jgi:Ion transport protein